MGFLCCVVVMHSSAPVGDDGKKASLSAMQKLQAEWPESAQVRALVDGQCPVCAQQKQLLESRDTSGSIQFVDVSDDEYDPSLNADITFNDAMASLHAIRRSDSKALAGVDALRLLYSQVGLGWVFAAASIPVLRPIVMTLYKWFSTARLRASGRSDILDVLQAAAEGIDTGGESCRVYSPDGGCADDSGGGGGSNGGSGDGNGDAKPAPSA